MPTRKTIRRPWAAVLAGPPEVTGDEMVAAMDVVGVDGALLVSPYTMYKYDASYALDVYAKHSDRFALIKPVDLPILAWPRRSKTGSRRKGPSRSVS